MKAKTKEITKKAYHYFSKEPVNEPNRNTAGAFSVLVVDNLLDILKFLDRHSICLFMLACKYFSQTNQIVSLRNAKLFLSKQTPIRTGTNHTFFITKKDKMWGCGSDFNKQFGRPPKSIELIKYDTNFLQKGDYIKEIAPAYRHVLLLSEHGQLFVWGSEVKDEVFKKFVQCDTSFLHPKETITSIAAGARFSLILTSEGRVFGRGQYMIGQTAGCQTHEGYIGCQGRFKALNIQGLSKNERVTSIDVRHDKISLCIDTKRFLLNEVSWNAMDFYHDIVLPLEEKGRITQVALSGNWFLVLTNTNQLYVKGYNDFGQLGLSHTKYVEAFQRCDILCLKENETISKIGTGSEHSLLLTSHDRLLVCGRNKEGQLGLSHTNDIYVFEECKPACLQAQEVIVAMDAGETHSVVYTSQGNYLSCGDNANYQLGTLKNKKIPQSQFMSCGPDTRKIGL